MPSKKTARMGDKAKPLAAYPPAALLFLRGRNRRTPYRREKVRRQVANHRGARPTKEGESGD
jgi:hypothetical protein